MLQVRVWTTSLMKWCAMLNLKGLHRFSMPYLGEVINSLMKWYVILRGRVRSTRLGIQCAEAAARAGVASAPYQAALCVPMHSRFTASLLSGVTTRIVVCALNCCVHCVSQGFEQCSRTESRCALAQSESKPQPVKLKLLCFHGREWPYCKYSGCGGSAYCLHNIMIQRKTCKICRGRLQEAKCASTTSTRPTVVLR